MPFERASGLLLHITSLPSPGGFGDLGRAAYEFADFLAAAKQSIWQVLPVNPTGYGGSPYAGLSAFAGNPLMISLDVLSEWGWIAAECLRGLPGREGAVDFARVEEAKIPLLVEAAENFLTHRPDGQWQRFEKFCRDEAYWLNDYAAYAVLSEQFQTSAWIQWPAEYRFRWPGAIERFFAEKHHEMAIEQALQFAFAEQWYFLREYCRERGIKIMGDVAIFVNYDSADVWRNPEMFELDGELKPIRVAGVPPDYFSVTGQRWGNPLYRWDWLEERGFDWWIQRLRRSCQLFDMVRLDHFRGFEAYWAIPALEETAINGEWVEAPGMELFRAVERALGELPFIAEDLGLITKEVDALREEFGFPGMRILQFGFGSRGAHNYLPHRYEANTVVYTGTHDNDTTAGWWASGATEIEQSAVREYTGAKGDDVVWPLMRSAATSVADIALFPVQDVLELGSEARMNTPSIAHGNWSWRLAPGALTPKHAEKLAAITVVSDRDGAGE
jgi:4-alpha-glucanotransferase